MTRTSIDTERVEYEIGEATLWVNTSVGKLTVHLGTLTSCLLLGYLLGRKKRSTADAAERGDAA